VSIAKAIADSMIERAHADKALTERALESPEPYRALAYECGLESIDGTELWSDVMDELDGRF